MAIIDHGKWVRYERPKDTPDSIPRNIVFVRREGDGKDWYLHVYGRRIGDPQYPLPKLDPKTLLPLPNQPPLPKSAFQPDSVKCAALLRKDLGVHIIGAATRDATAIFPVNQYVFEVTDYKGHDPQMEFSGMAYDPKTKEISAPPKLPEPPPSPAFAELLERVEALEKAQR